MGLFKRRTTKAERLQELDRSIRDARDKLNREIIRGYIIQWIKSFDRLDRFFLYKYSSEEEKSFILTREVMDSTSFRRAYEEENSTAVAVVLFDLAQGLESHIRRLAGKQGINSKKSLEEIILELTEYGQIQRVVIYLKELERNFG